MQPTSVTIVSSTSAEPGKTQTGLVYLCSALARRGAPWELIDLSGSVEFYRTPEDLYQPWDSPEWMNAESIRQADWLDEYLPSPDVAGDVVLFSAQFSPDLVFHARHSHNIKARNRQAVTAIGGAALTGLRLDQKELLACFFDHVLVGYDVDRLLATVFDDRRRTNGRGRIAKAMDAPQFRPDYSLLPLEDFVTVYAGHGCYHGRCRFCDFPSRADRQVVFRQSSEVAEDVRDILRMRPSVRDVFLTQDCYTQAHLCRTASDIKRLCGQASYSLMLRAEPWLREEIGEMLAGSGCTDVFIGAEGLDDEILQRLDKGLTARGICDAVKCLAPFVDVSIGMILFIPGISERAMNAQLAALEAILPYVAEVELEVLTVVNGSDFAKHPWQYGIVLYPQRNVLNDSWCFGLSQDIPWTMADVDAIPRWFRHAQALRGLCGDLVRPVYWENLHRLAEDLGCDGRE